MSLGPLLTTPRLDPKPWGGARLAAMGYAADGPEPLGEVVMTLTTCRVAGGPHDGRTLGELIAADPVAMVGRRGLAATGGRALFPLLVKLIDAAEPLSIQVHPDDGRVESMGSLGKTEVWHVLAADPGATYFAGVVEGVGAADLAEAVDAGPGDVARHVRRLSASPGETIFLPAGTLHALGAGVMVYELQQQSEITYRLDDWGRVGGDGKARPMHVAEALEAVDPSIRPEVLRPVRLSTPGCERDLLAACRCFALDRFRIPAHGQTRLSAVDTAQTITVVSGAIEELRTSGQDGPSIRVAAGQTAVVPASVGTVEPHVVQATEILRAWVPDIDGDIVRPAMAEGISPEALIALSAPLDDVADAVRRVGSD